MRLLRLEGNGEFSLAEFYGKQIPKYAVLSHTWGADTEEVSFKDIEKGTGRNKDKAGYSKLHFCAEQAANDSIQYFWVDTCCIDKTSSAELSEAINSMFRWYQEAAKCYVYLADVSIEKTIDETVEYDLLSQQTWKPAFQRSRWFTRGWTLQELLAPLSVEFFAAKGERLGDKHSLLHDINEATGISFQALQGSPSSLSQFSVDERMSWAAERETKREEDAAYSLLGLFDLHMPLIYGEGRNKAFIRLHREIESASAYEKSHGVNIDPQNEPHRRIGEASRYSPPTDTTMPTSLRKRKADIVITQTSDIGRASQQPRLLEQSSETAEDAMPQGHAGAMQMWWDEAIARNMNPPDGYHKVAVLLVKWAGARDGLQTRNEVEELETLFRKRFNFHTEIIELNVSSKPQHQMDRYLMGFIERNDGLNNLLIVYYTGKAMYNEIYDHLELEDDFDLTLTRGSKSVGRVNWRRAEDILRSDEVDGDVLAILDTNHMGHLVKRGNANQQGDSAESRGKETKLFELMSSQGIGSTAATSGENSFTRALIDALTDLSKQYGPNSFTTFRLNQWIFLTARRPSMLWMLMPNERHISLAPMKVEKDHGNMTSRRPRAYLTLRLAFREESLDQKQIEILAKNLANFRNNPIPGLFSIDWLGIKLTPLRYLERAASVVLAVAKWKRYVRKRRRPRRLQRKVGESDLLTED